MEVANSDAASDPCNYAFSSDPSDVAMLGHSGEPGYVLSTSCPAALEFSRLSPTSTQPRNLTRVFMDMGSTFVPEGTPAPTVLARPAPPDPAELAQRAIATLPIVTPTLRMGPNPELAVVHKPLWLWVDDPGAQTRTVALLGVQVTLTAHLASTDWSMGEPVERPGTTPQTEATVHCAGAGEQPPTQGLPADPLTWRPACGYAFHWRSLPERTQGIGAWTVSATTTWDVEWTSNIGVNGSATLRSQQAQTWIDVREIRTALVHDPNASPPTGRPAANTSVAAGDLAPTAPGG